MQEREKWLSGSTSYQSTFLRFSLIHCMFGQFLVKGEAAKTALTYFGSHYIWTPEHRIFKFRVFTPHKELCIMEGR